MTTSEDTCVSRFIKGFDVYMKSMVKEAEDRENKRARTVDDYLQLRWQTFVAQASISFLSFGLELPEEVLLHPVMQTVTLASMDILCIINVSFEFDRTFKLTVMIQPPTYYALITCCLVSLVLISQYTVV